MKVEKAIFPIAGLATRFLPLSKSISKELLPLVDKPLVNYTVEEAYLSGIKDIQFVTRKNQKDFLNCFKKDENLEKMLIERDRKAELAELEKIEKVGEEINFSSVIQKVAKGDANAIYEARDFAGKDAVGIFFCDDIIHSLKEDPGLQQLKEVFENCQSPVIGLKKLPKDRLSSYGVVDVEKIANGFYKIKGITQKPKDNPPSDLAVVGRMIITPDVFDYMSKNKHLREKDSSITTVLGEMVSEGKAVYGYELKGDWLECGDKALWFKSFIALAMDHPQYGSQIRDFLKKKKL